MLRDALRRHLLRLASEVDAETWREKPLTDEERSLTAIEHWARPRVGRIGPMQRGEVWFAATPGGDRPCSSWSEIPVADRIGAVVVAALSRTVRGLVSELELTPDQDGVPSTCVANFDNLYTLPKEAFRRRVTSLSAARMSHACRVLHAASGC